MFWEAVRKEPISHWLMLWSSNGIREARKEIDSAQPRWSKKFERLRYIGYRPVHGSGRFGFGPEPKPTRLSRVDES